MYAEKIQRPAPVQAQSGTLTLQLQAAPAARDRLASTLNGSARVQSQLRLGQALNQGARGVAQAKRMQGMSGARPGRFPLQREAMPGDDSAQRKIRSGAEPAATPQAEVMQRIVIPLDDLEALKTRTSQPSSAAQHDAQVITDAVKLRTSRTKEPMVRPADAPWPWQSGPLADIGNEEIRIFGHGATTRNSDVAVLVGGYEPATLVALLKKLGLPKDYAGLIYLTGCKTAAGDGWGYLGTFYQLLKAHAPRVKVKGNLGNATTLTNGEQAIFQSAEDRENFIALQSKALLLQRELMAAANHSKSLMEELSAAQKEIDTAQKHIEAAKSKLELSKQDSALEKIRNQGSDLRKKNDELRAEKDKVIAKTKELKDVQQQLVKIGLAKEDDATRTVVLPAVPPPSFHETEAIETLLPRPLPPSSFDSRTIDELVMRTERLAVSSVSFNTFKKR